jgi:ATP-dependent DNA helicase RecG
MTVNLTNTVTSLSGVGDALQTKLNRLGIYQIQDLLFHLPYRYIDKTRLTPIGSMQAGKDALIQGMIELTQVQFGRRRSLLCRLSDGTGAVTLRFFHFNKSQQKSLEKGVSLRCWGTVRKGRSTLEMIHPEYQRIVEDGTQSVEENLTPVYPTTEGLNQGRLRKLSEQCIAILIRDKINLAELLPDEILQAYALPSLADALQYVHRPPPDANITELMQGTHPAQQRLAFEELLAHHLSLRTLRKQVDKLTAPVLPLQSEVINSFIAGLEFELTQAQKRVLKEIQTDFSNPSPMMRLIQGDVGSGKTIVAAVTALQAYQAGFQVAVMAPTELLADQHYKNFTSWFDEFEIPVLQLTGKLGKNQRQVIHQQLMDNAPLIIVGTHALFQDDVHFSRLGLVIIDEQHRFGVQQRLSLFEKGTNATSSPHQLIMTATPIPRTLAMTVFADLDISIIDELPPGRQPITTVAISNQRRDEIIARIADVCQEHQQVYWVCTLIDESDNVQYQAATDTFEYLTGELPQLNIGLIHGRMKSKEKEQQMAAYKSGKIELLVATTVIEVGVDVPSANLMIIENAERLGLSQLHQLRGRVGRGAIQSVCVLMYQQPLSEMGQARLEIMRATNDGFEIAKKDMELRGPGEIFGTRQTGLPTMRIADLMRDAHLVPKVQDVASKLMANHSDQVNLLIERWVGKDSELVNV